MMNNYKFLIKRMKKSPNFMLSFIVIGRSFIMSNPVFNEKVLNNQESILEGEPCTVQGTIVKTLLLLCVLVASFGVTFNMCLKSNIDTAMTIGLVGIIAAFILAIIISFKPKTAPVLSPIYAFGEGLVLGGISFIFEASYPGIVMVAVAATFLSLFLMLMLYKSQLVQVTEKLRSTILIATLGVAGIYLITWILSFFHIQVPAIYSSGPIGIVFSLIVCAIAISNFLLDFDIINRLSANFAPKYYEWYGAFGLLVTLVWVYMEILRLLGKLRSRN